MARVCMRPGCELAAAARLTFDPVSCQAWLDVLVDRPGSAQEVCELHADRLTLPRGWMLCDRRADEPALFVGASTSAATPTAPAAPTAPSAPVVRRRRRSVAPQPSLTPPAPVAAELFDAPPDPLAAATPPPPAASEDPLELSASSPLLARAFRATGNQHSVLTEGARPVRHRAPDRRLDDD